MLVGVPMSATRGEIAAVCVLINKVPCAGTGSGRGSGRELALAFLYFAPKLGYRSSVFNLVFETNTSSIRLWEKLRFEKVGIVKGAGRLKGHAELVDALFYGYEFPESTIDVGWSRTNSARPYG